MMKCCVDGGYHSAVAGGLPSFICLVARLFGFYRTSLCGVLRKMEVAAAAISSSKSTSFTVVPILFY